jgi:hypothetical protein
VKTVIQNSDGTQTVVGLEDGALVTGTVQDCTPIAEFAKAAHNAGAFGSSEMRHAARIPMVFIEKYLNDNRITLNEFCKDKTHVRRLLQDPALDHFRIWKGKI